MGLYRATRIATFLGVLGLAVGCDNGEGRENPFQARARLKAAARPSAALVARTAAQAPEPASDGEKEALHVWTSRCITCHGPKGDGDGPAGASLSPKPAKFSDPAWQASISDQEILMAIVGGGQSVAKSPAMVPNPDLALKPEVVEALRAKVRSMVQK